MKCDDDTFVRVDYVMANVKKIPYGKSFYLGNINYYHRPMKEGKWAVSIEVFTFGSVPLKTYLPDGDIDVTAFSDNEELKNAWVNLVRDALEHEEKSENTEFRVKSSVYTGRGRILSVIVSVKENDY
ncbi:hypothetical protein ABZP36_028428 [Zizania latifolia]